MRDPRELPILLLAFRRPACTLRVIEALRICGMRQVTFACDGPKPDASEADRRAIEAVRGLVDRFGADCHVTTRFAPANLGCRKHVSMAITEFLEAHGEGLILEDDCVPAPDLPRFAAELLDRWRDEPRVGSIAGTRLVRRQQAEHPPYVFSCFTSSWGWATWRRAWIDRDLALNAWAADRETLIRRFTPLVGGAGAMQHWAAIFDTARAGRDSWATGWFFSNLLHGRLTAIPNVNLVSNIGFDDSATHTRGARRFARPCENLARSPHHPTEPVRDQAFDASMAREIFTPTTNWYRLRTAFTLPARIALRWWQGA